MKLITMLAKEGTRLSLILLTLPFMAVLTLFMLLITKVKLANGKQQLRMPAQRKSLRSAPTHITGAA